MADDNLEDVLKKLSQAIKEHQLPLEEAVKLLDMLEEFEEKMRLDGKQPELSKIKLYTAHSPDARDFVSKLSDAFKEQGVEITGRTFWERRYVFSEEDASHFNELANQYLKEANSPQPIQMQPRLFLSYAKEDYPDIQHLAQQLNTELSFMGVQPWLDREDMIDDDNWIEEVLQALTSCCGMFVLFSRYSINSRAVNYEMDFFLERMKKRSGIFFAIGLLEYMDIGEHLKSQFPGIDLCKMSSKRAAAKIAREMAAFFIKYARSVDSIASNIE